MKEERRWRRRRRRRRRRRCGEIDSLASQQFNTTELLLHSSPYEMRSLSLCSASLLRSLTFVYVCMHVCVSACVYPCTCDPLTTRSILSTIWFLKVHLSVSGLFLSFLFSCLRVSLLSRPPSTSQSSPCLSEDEKGKSRKVESRVAFSAFA